MVYDSVRQRIVVYGGLGTSRLGDTWEYGENLRQLVIVVPRGEEDNRGPLEFKFIVEHKLDFQP